MRLLLCGNRSRGGQVLVLFVLALLAMIAMVGLVVEGGNILAQQRMAQNSTDSAANAGTIVIAESLAGASRTGADVYAAVSSAATANQLAAYTAVYTNEVGAPLTPGVPVVNGGSIPPGARGVAVAGDRSVETILARVVGITQLTASADATAIAGALAGGCPTESGCAMLPVTFPITVSICDGQGTFTGIGGPGDLWQVVGADERTAANEAIVPLCKVDPGSVGYLDLDPSKNLAGEILGPIDGSFSIPTWLQTQTGNVNSVEGEFNTWADKPVLIPLFDGTCRVDPGDASSAATCPEDQRGTDPSGNNTWYHIPYFVTFWLDQAYVQGRNVEACASDPGTPKVDPSSPGFLGCLKGWFVEYVYNGPIDPGKDVSGPTAIGVQLIR